MASTVRSHRANQGSIPCIGVYFFFLTSPGFYNYKPKDHLINVKCSLSTFGLSTETAKIISLEK